MPVTQWSESIVLVDLGDEPQFSEDMLSLRQKIDMEGPMHVVFNMEGVRHLNSTNIGAILRFRQRLINGDCQMRLCSVPDSLWGVLLVMGLDKVLECSPDVSSALAALQLDE